MPDNQLANRKKETVLCLEQHHSFSGPLPPPEILQKFDQIVPGAAERIIKMAEGQFEHRIELEKKVIDSDIRNSRLGQIFGFIIGITGLIVSGVVIVSGKELVGGLIGGVTLVSLVSVFIYGSRTRSQEREQKDSK